MKKVLIVVLVLFLFVSLCSCGEAKDAQPDYEHELELAYERGYDQGYEAAEEEYRYKLEDLQDAYRNTFDMVMRLSAMLEEAEYYTQDDLFTESEAILDYMRNYR